ncbi:condensation domain-containing protein [Streptomyces sp. NBC_01485]|uniref:condensation domain-containing protein n=1 Tax=Streptomyces sp. NBC_01485 TaxID=2903884 RepID=UPI002E31E2F8|nr:condensation domain-containing protein [Streptomyces sp. NBC_01485]
MPENDGGDVFALSFGQRRLVRLHALDATGFVHSSHRCFHVSGGLDLVALQAAVDTLVARHEPLRTVFPAAAGHQRVMPSGHVPVRFADLAADGAGSDATRRIPALVARPFDLEHGPLLRAWALRLGTGRHLLVFSLHLLAADGWALQVFFRELGEAYRAAVRGEVPALLPLPVQYADWAAWQAHRLTPRREACLAHWWREELSGVPLTVHLAERRMPAAGPPQDGRGGVIRPCLTPASQAGRAHRPLAPASVDAARSLARGEGRTLFTVLAAVFALVLHHHSGQDRLLIGLAVACREQPEVANILGFLVNTVCLRADLTGDPDVRELLSRVARATADAYDHKDLPFEHLVRGLGPPHDPRRSPVGQVNLAHHPPGTTGVLELPGCLVAERPIDGIQPKFELTIRVEETDDATVALSAEYAPDRYKAAFIHQLLRTYERFLQAAATSPDTRVSRLSTAAQFSPECPVPRTRRIDASSVDHDR